MSGGVVAPPGTPAAVSRGCSCVPYDDDGPRDPRWPGWLTVGCPVQAAAMAAAAGISIQATDYVALQAALLDSAAPRLPGETAPALGVT